MRKLTFVGVLSILVFFLSVPNVFASTGTDESDFSIDLEKSSYETVSEEEVIQSYMEGQNVDRSTAKKELGITDTSLETGGFETMSFCATGWRRYTSEEKTIDSGTYSTLALQPYVQVESCSHGGAETFLKLSKDIGVKKNSLMGDSTIVVSSVNGELNGDSQIYLSATGYVKNYLGVKLRYWSYNDVIYAN